MLLAISTRTVLAPAEGGYSAAGGHGGYFVADAAVLPRCCECELPRAVCLKHRALSLVACGRPRSAAPCTSSGLQSICSSLLLTNFI